MTKPHARNLGLLALLLAWSYLCWPNWEEQWAVTGQAWAAFGNVPWEERGAVEWPAGFKLVREIQRAVPPGRCVVVVAKTTPEKLAYYRGRFPYYLYPRRVWLVDRPEAAPAGCPHRMELSE
jgi:hypothetical protein